MQWNSASAWTLISAALILGCSVPRSANLTLAGDGFQIVQSGEIVDRRIEEISGIAASLRSPGRYWVINDSGNEAKLHLIDLHGNLFHSVVVQGAVNIDWEDLAAFQENGRPRLLIADTGANAVERSYLSLYLLDEPDESADSVSVDQGIDFVFPDGVLDCEAAAVDVEARKILLIDKRTVPPVCAELPLHPASAGILTAERVAEATTVRQPTPEEIERPLDRHHAQITAMDLAPDRSRLALLTYRRLYIYDIPAGEPWYAAPAREPKIIEFPALQQAEAVCFSGDGASLIMTTEKLPAPLLKVVLKDKS
ncbi:MAG: hypothetical protein ONB24_12225 [candidate division KSB1 bacterium]|nr:hypothetical protein [candidate division KSB1 bacterium]